MFEEQGIWFEEYINRILEIPDKCCVVVWACWPYGGFDIVQNPGTAEMLDARAEAETCGFLQGKTRACSLDTGKSVITPLNNNPW